MSKKAPKGKKKGGLPKRITKEIEKLKKDKTPGIVIAVHEENFRHFDVSIQGPPGSPYEEGTFKLEIFLTTEYPLKPPKCRFITRIYHPNVDKLGRICLDILKSKWSPALTIPRVCLSIQALMGDPNPDDPLDNTVADLWKADEAKAKEYAREWTTRYAM
jgi:ubiquitin-conjugating enzyme E2 N